MIAESGGFDDSNGPSTNNGQSETLTNIQASGGSWWTGGSGPDWSARWGGTKAGIDEETKVWHWDEIGDRPILWFQNSLND